MSVEGRVPPARQREKRALIANVIRAATVLVTMAIVACNSDPAPHLVVSEPAPDKSRVAFVRLQPCGAAWCESLWIGADADSATRLATLPQGEEQCDEIAWTRDGKRVAFLVNGYQLRLYDSQSHAPAGLIDLVSADGTPTTRIARGITFSENGAAVTFDDCPRERSGCKPGMLGLR
jgi:hypothetical protein